MNDTLRPRGPLWTLYEHLAMDVGLGALALLCLTWLPFAMLLHPLLPRPVGQRLVLFLAKPVSYIGDIFEHALSPFLNSKHGRFCQWSVIGYL